MNKENTYKRYKEGKSYPQNGIPLLERTRHYGVWEKGRNIYTKNMTPGEKVYDESIIHVEGEEYRSWNPRKSKIAAALIKGLNNFPFTKNDAVLYLGAASGTTASHLSDICANGIIFGIDFAPRVVRELYFLSEKRKNIVPILADAYHPEEYMNRVCKVDIIVQDIAQKNQVEILKKNLIFLKNDGMIILSLKAKSIDVTKNPNEIYKRVRKELSDFLTILEEGNLDPFEKDHMLFVCRKINRKTNT